MILLVDNFDSFTYNLVDYFARLGEKCLVRRNDVSLEELDKLDFDKIVLSPGPGKPEDAGNLMKVIDAYHLKYPMLGICLGHQALASYFGGNIKKALRPMHGKVSNVKNFQIGVFKGLPEQFDVVRYHSLVVDNLPDMLEKTALVDTGEIMGLRHVELPLEGVQFHPEAILTENGLKILHNWIQYNNSDH
ncbi:anthranilate synthase component II [Aureibacter tunicatorum]|uniref:Anthranilate synthase component 2 n=1 Tax=Aureibacter tunicatorum TaxID=866807 RepID=A0AAE3XLN8_9BACT|nr:aminodeoxychorismate/anthranilate synthase component II [Aureibacter tunicatorum]MDR6238066.1 anthranilate synthase component 2 [Aureibacter tunicatorum]BDD03099.1 glutamine amidotransferase [Aureibacter tunicatorum]